MKWKEEEIRKKVEEQRERQRKGTEYLMLKVKKNITGKQKIEELIKRKRKKGRKRRKEKTRKVKERKS